MKKKFFLNSGHIFVCGILLAFLLLPQTLNAQIKTRVSFVSSQFIYVIVPSGYQIEKDDTLYVLGEYSLRPVLKASFTSSRSAACIRLDSTLLAVSDTVLFFAEKNNLPSVHRNEKRREVVLPTGESTSVKKTVNLNNWSGRFSVNSFSVFTNTAAREYLRWRYSFQITGEDIFVTGLHIRNYMNFSYSIRDWQQVKTNLGRALKIYDLSAEYVIDSSVIVSGGRTFNQHLSGIGAFDGLSAEKKFSSYYIGGFLGSRPNFDDYGFTFKNFQTGVYAGKRDSLFNGEMENTLGIYHQTNSFKTDRQFIYFQHTGNPSSHLSFYFSGEADVYEKILGNEKQTLSLTGLYGSARYSPISGYSLALSYDARRNVYYYETYKSSIDSTIARDLRSGVRLQCSLRPINGIVATLNVGYRFAAGDTKSSKHIGSTVFFTTLPLISGTAYTGVNYLSGTYITTSDYSFGYSLPITEFIDLSLNARHAKWQYPLVTASTVQNSINADLSVSLTNKFWLLLSYESLFIERNTDTRIVIDLSTRF